MVIAWLIITCVYFVSRIRISYYLPLFLFILMGCRGRDCMVVGFTSICAISADKSLHIVMNRNRTRNFSLHMQL